jgi:ankyrin repeat protein/beta-lactamase regulating signal transducer with metallopeptidase domain
MSSIMSIQAFEPLVYHGLLHFLWVGTVFGILAYAVRKSTAIFGPGTRYTLLLMIFLCLTLSPFVIAGRTWLVLGADVNATLPRSLPTIHTTVASDRLAVTGDPVLTGVPSQSLIDGKPHSIFLGNPVGEETVAATPSSHPDLASASNSAADQASSSVAPVPQRTTPKLSWIPSLTTLTVTYLVGVSVVLLRLSLAYAGGRRLHRNSMPLEEPDVLSALGRQATRLGLAVTPAVAVCADLAVPCVVGILRPVLLLPPDLALVLTPRQLSWVLAHELAHIRRYDYLVNFLQSIVEAILFFHPAVWFVSSCIRREREYCCDELAVEQQTHRVEYARTLLMMAERLLPQPVSPALAVHALDDRSEGVRRIARLVRPKESFHFRTKSAWWSIFFSSLVALVVLLQSPTAIATFASSTYWQGHSKPTVSLVEAAETGTPSDIRQLVLLGAPVNGTDARGWSPLHHAAAAGRADNVRELLSLGANPVFASGSNLRTPLLGALGYGGIGLRKPPADNSEVVKVLANRTTCIPDSSGIAPVHAAAITGDIHSLKVLLEFADPNLVTPLGETPLTLACYTNEIDVAQVLLDAGANPNLRNSSGLAAVHLLARARCKGDTPSPALDPTFRRRLLGDIQMTPCLAAALGDNETLAKMLAEVPATANQIDPNLGVCDTPLNAAIASGNYLGSFMLLDAGADPNLVGPSGWRPFLRACSRNSSWELMDALVRRGANVNGSNLIRGTPLNVACSFCSVEPIRYLVLTARVNVNKPDDEGETPLEILAGRLTRKKPEVAEIIKFVVTAGASTSVRDSAGVLPIAIAAKSANLYAIDAFIAVTPPEYASEKDLAILRSCRNQLDASACARLDRWTARAVIHLSQQSAETPSTLPTTQNQFRSLTKTPINPHTGKAFRALEMSDE